jgi:diguanylate cyclase (GGDEF)-like protein/PAS domain S-box-containing protein
MRLRPLATVPEEGNGRSLGDEGIEMRIQAEANLSALIESTEDLIWSVDPRLRLITFNRAFKEYFEQNFGGPVTPGMSVRELHPPALAVFWLPLYERALTGKTFSVEHTIADGRTLEISFSPIVAEGETTGVSVFGKDITERKKAENELRTAEADLTALIESTRDLVWSVDLDYRLTAFNGALRQNIEETFGVRLEIGMRHYELFPPERAVLWQQFYARAISEGPFRIEYSLIQPCILELAFNPILVDGKITGISVFGKDITERKRAEQALQESEARFRNFFEQNGSVMILVAPENGEIVAANRAASKYYGYSREQLIGMNVSRVNTLPPQEVALEQQRALSEERNFFNFRHRLASGEVRDVEVYSSPVEADGRRLLFSIVHDITERKRAEEALRESEARLQLFIECAPAALAMFDSQMRYLAASRRWMADYGLGDREIRGLSHYEVFPEISERWKAFHRRGLAGEVIREASDPFERADGSVQLTRWEIRPWHFADGRVGGIVIFTEDLTERERTEALLRESSDFLKEAQRIGDLGCYVLDVPKGVWTSTSRLDEIFGIDESYQRTVKGWEALVHPEDRAMMNAYLVGEVIGQRKPFDKEYRILRPSDGATRWVRGLGKLDFDAGGRPLKMRGIISDTTAHRQREMQLRDSEERYRTVFQTCPDAVMISRLSDGVILDANQTLLDMAGYERNKFVGHTTTELGIWVNDGDRQKLVDELLRNTEFRDFEVPFRRKNGETFWVRLDASLIEIGGIRCLLAFAQDISAAKEAKDLLTAAAEALRLSEERYRTAFQTSIDAININRLNDGKYIDCNQAFLDIMGYEREEVIGKTSLQLGIWADTRDRTTMANLVRENGSCRSLEVQFKKKNGELFWGVMSASVMEVDGVPCILSITRDLSEVKAAQSEIRTLAYYDPLTGLPNRRLLLERLRQTLAAGGRSSRLHALLFVELDNFKMLNETIGHLTGDLLLMEVARRIVTCAREADIVSRFGGDEFALMLEDLSEIAEEAAAQAKTVAEKIQDSIGLPFLLEGRECITTASIGITVFGTDREGTSELIQEADIAIYQATSAGRNTIHFFSPALQTAVNARATLEEDLRQAIKDRQFLLYYQPLVARGRLIGAEALIRWQHPTRGLVWPGEFIPLAEETGLILPLGDWVLKAACEQLAAWAGRKLSAHLSLAVNISALQFRQSGFVATVLSALERSGANPNQLKLELTESMLVENIEEVIAKMTELKAYGLSFSLDDFGTGYSSLAYLKRLPLGLLKIDRAFVRDMLVDATSGAIAQTIISLGRAMGLSVIAEGVESEEQRGFLAGLGCYTFQGFLFSPPLPLEQFDALL